MLKIQNLTKSFNGFVATNGVDLTIAESERHAIIGPNGAGKSTLFNLITGHLRPDSGTVIYRGEDDHRDEAPYDRTKGGLALLPAYECLSEAYRLREHAGRAHRPSPDGVPLLHSRDRSSSGMRRLNFSPQ